MQKRFVLTTCALVLLAAAPALAQNSVRTAGEKISGAAYREQSSQAYWSGAYGHADTLNNYTRTYSYIPAETAEEHTTEVNRNVTAAKKEVSKLGSKAKTDKKLQGHVDTLHKHYDAALAHSKTLSEESKKGDKADPKKLHESATGMTDSLKAADAEHKKLNEHLKTTDSK
jgi:lipoate-protein ligase A